MGGGVSGAVLKKFHSHRHSGANRNERNLVPGESDFVFNLILILMMLEI